MKISTQGGQEINTHRIELEGHIIRCVPDTDKRKKMVCGTYESRARATEVYAEMVALGWNEDSPEYTMPKC